MKNVKNSQSYSVIIVSDAKSTNKEFAVSAKFIKTSILAFSFLVVFFGFIIFQYLTMTLDKQKMKRLELEANDKQQKISALTSTIEDLNQRLKNIENYKERIMVATGLTSPLALKEVGSGGPEFNDQMTNGFPMAQKTLPDGIISQPQNLLSKTKAIKENAKQIEASLKSVESMVNQQKLQLAATPIIWPTRGYLSGFFGNRIHPFTGRLEFHYGLDIATQLGNKVVATADGVVLVAERRDYIGNTIIIDHGFGYVTHYGHLSGFKIREGQRVKRYDVIGYVGTSGRSTGPHLHYEVRYFNKPMNPADFILDSQN
ncbi:MAG: peptidoglycan DD-metalloendopeptidase family protein [Candidatus Aminicenantes bacterium]|nr:peptidoglycan DD-metalloendopeptidase family protein [Candidatus Aminicenantes bacterium]